MSEIVVVYELDKSAADRTSPGVPHGAERPVRRVHAAPAAPGEHTAAGPRTLCGKDTFAMETSSWKALEDSGAAWYPEEYVSVVCPDCDAVMEI